jgi:hypothetical protein
VQSGFETGVTASHTAGIRQPQVRTRVAFTKMGAARSGYHADLPASVEQKVRLRNTVSEMSTNPRPSNGEAYLLTSCLFRSLAFCSTELVLSDPRGIRRDLLYFCTDCTRGFHARSLLTWLLVDPTRTTVMLSSCPACG